MYIPPAFAEDRPEALTALMAAYPLATLITNGARCLDANMIPMRYEAGVLRAHLARANPQLTDLRAMADAGQEVLVLFQGPQAYVTPSWYASKREHGRVVPTWNFLVVELRAVPRVIDDPSWLKAQVTDLTDSQETGQQTPWAVIDAPDRFIAAKLRGIVGLELTVMRMAGKWKASQNRDAADRVGVIAGLGDHPLAAAMSVSQD